MSDGYLTITHGQVSLGGEQIPGELYSLEISGDVRFDTAEVDNLSGKAKTPLGWEDSLITVELILLSDDTGTCYDKLRRINAVFKGQDNDANPKVYDLVNAHTSARDIEQVVFKGLRSRETNQDDVIKATLSFDEHNPPTIPPEVQTSATDASQTDAPQVDAEQEAVADADVTADEASPFDAGFREGLS